jgi:hypothetical protein
MPLFLQEIALCLVANLGPVGAAEGCDRGVSGEMLRSLRQLLQKMHFNPLICILFDESVTVVQTPRCRAANGDL